MTSSLGDSLPLKVLRLKGLCTVVRFPSEICRIFLPELIAERRLFLRKERDAAVICIRRNHKTGLSLTGNTA